MNIQDIISFSSDAFVCQKCKNDLEQLPSLEKQYIEKINYLLSLINQVVSKQFANCQTPTSSTQKPHGLSAHVQPLNEGDINQGQLPKVSRIDREDEVSSVSVQDLTNTPTRECHKHESEYHPPLWYFACMK